MGKNNLLFMVILYTVICAVVIIPIYYLSEYEDDKDSYCELNGYQSATNADIRNIDDVDYIECYIEDVINKTRIETEDWIVFKGD